MSVLFLMLDRCTTGTWKFWTRNDLVRGRVRKDGQKEKQMDSAEERDRK